jgi:hypothetical protein
MLRFDEGLALLAIVEERKDSDIGTRAQLYWNSFASGKR